MTYGVFDERLKNETGHREIHRLRLDAKLNVKAIFKTNTLNFQIRLQKLHLAPQRYFIDAGAFECEPEKIAQPRRHAGSGFDVRHLKSGNRIECVEEKVRLQLPL